MHTEKGLMALRHSNCTLKNIQERKKGWTMEALRAVNASSKPQKMLDSKAVKNPPINPAYNAEKDLRTNIDSVLSQTKGHLSSDVDNWLNDLTSGYDGFSQLIQKYGFEDVLCKMAEKHWLDRAFIASKMLEVKDFFCHIKRPVNKKLTIAFFYPKLTNDGAERVTAQLVSILSNVKDSEGNAKYRVVLITDEPKLENEYPLDGPISREFLPNWHTCAKGNYRSRFQAWERIIKKWDIDIVTSGDWCGFLSLWDMLTVKGQPSKPAFILHIHNFTMRPYLWKADMGLALTYFYRICDAAVTLSECDKEFVQLFCTYVQCIPNPLNYLIENSSSGRREEHAIVWTGRIVPQKQPMDMVRMMGYVAKKIPDAKLYLVGTGDEKLTQRIKSEAVKLGLQKNVVFTGYTNDVASYYKRASLYVCTSQFEGFSLSIAEAFSLSLPVVMYDLPNLTFVKDGRGIKTVPMGRYDLLAKAVIQLLENPDELKKMGREGRAQIEEMSRFDIAGAWQNVFEEITPGKTSVRAASDERILFEYLSIYQENAKKELASKFKETILPQALPFARIDVKNSGADSNDVEIIDVSDTTAKVNSPDWMRKNGMGRVIRSKSGTLAFKLKCIGAGKLTIDLKGEDVRNAENKRIPIWVGYSKLIVDGKIIFGVVKPACCDAPQKFSMNVEDGQVVDVHAEWVPNCVSIGPGLVNVSRHHEAELSNAKAETAKARKQVEELKLKLKTFIAPAKVSHARLDLKNSGLPMNDVEVIEISDSDAKVNAPDWMRKNGMGLVIRSKAGVLSFKLKCTGDGKLAISLKGEDVRDAKGKRIPVWVNYTKLTVDSKVIFEDVKPAWHDAPETFSIEVKDGQILDVQAEWAKDCISVGPGLTKVNSEHEKVRKLVKDQSELMEQQRWYENELKLKLDELSAELQEKKAEKLSLEEELLEIRSGISFKLGRLLTYIPRKLLGKE